jgi:hypothetical protein
MYDLSKMSQEDSPFVPPAALIIEQSQPNPEFAVRLLTLPAILRQTKQDFPNPSKIEQTRTRQRSVNLNEAGPG